MLGSDAPQPRIRSRTATSRHNHKCGVESGVDLPPHSLLNSFFFFFSLLLYGSHNPREGTCDCEGRN
jgi:hypothetical protein